MNLKKVTNFLKYNNAALLLALAVFLVGSSVFAAPLAKDALGAKSTSIKGTDNTVLLLTKLDIFDMKYKVEAVTEDIDFYYVKYTYRNLEIKDNAWQEIGREATIKVTKKLQEDLGQYIASQLKDEYAARIAELTSAKEQALQTGPEKRQEVTEYSGLIGKVLDVSKEVFPGYEPVKVMEVASPEVPAEVTSGGTGPDNIEKIYDNYVKTHLELNSPISSNLTEASSTTPVVTESTTPVKASETIPAISPETTDSSTTPTVTQ